MSDTLKIFGSTYTDVTSIKAKDPNGNTLVFTREQIPTHTVTITSSGQKTYAEVQYNDVQYYTSGDTFSVNENDTIVVNISYGETNYIRLNDEIVKSGTQPTYSHTITCDTEIRFSLSRGQSNVYITELSDIVPLTVTENGTYTATGSTSGYSPITVNVPTGTTINNQDKSVTPSETAQTVTADSGYTGLGTVSVGAIDSEYVGSDVTRRTSSDLTASGATVSVPAGYYSASASKAVATGTAGTPTATKGTVSNNSISITPSVTNTTGYITGGTQTGTAVSVTASDLVSGTKSITTNGTSDVTNYASVSVDVSPSLQSKTATPTESSQTITADSNYDGLSSVTVGAISSTYVGSDIAQNDSTDLSASGATVTVPAGYYAQNASKSVSGGSATTPATAITANPTISVSSSGLITATASASQNITPTVSAGYVSAGTAGTVTVSGSKTQQLTAKGATTYNTSTTDQTIASGTYLTGTQTIKAVTTANLSAANIKAGVTVNVGDTNDADRIAGVTGTFTSDATASAADIASGETAYVNGSKVTGTLSFVTYYTGSSAPSSSLGENGSIYLKTTS